MSWLKGFGVKVVEGLGIAAGIFGIAKPVVAGVVPSASNDLTAIGQVIATTEAVFRSITTTGSGADKLRAAAPIVKQVILTSELLAGKHVKNEQAFTEACTRLTSDIADLLNAVE